jgi:hypothetical protein
MMDVRWNYDTTKQTMIAMDGNYAKAIHVHELYNNRMQNIRKKYFSSTSCCIFYSLLFLFLPKLLQGLLIT